MDISLDTGKFYKAKGSNLGEIVYFYTFSRHVSVHSPLTKKEMKEMVGDFEERFNTYFSKVVKKTFNHELFSVTQTKAGIQFKVDNRKWQWLTIPPIRHDGCQIYVSAVITVQTEKDLNLMKIKNSSLLNKMEESNEYASILLFDHSHLKMLFTDFKDQDFFIREFCYIR